MRTLAIASVVILALGGSAFAQMCGGGMQQQATTAQSGEMGCMGMMKQTADDPIADKSTSKPMQMGGMMCPCCRNMASMGGIKPGSSSDQHKHETPPSKQ